ncbi:hypothetical protein AB9K41_07510, partial [Cribrihabitans sp. XS_ASV171]
MTEVPIPPELFWGLVAVFALIVGSAVVFWVMPRSGHRYDPFVEAQERLGLAEVPPALFVFGSALWLVVLLLLVAGLLTEIWHLVWTLTSSAQAIEWRFTFAKLAALTAVLGAVVAFPVTLRRLALTRDQTKTAEDSLFNEKINAASGDLHAMRQRWDKDLKENIWEPDIVRRNAAIDALEGLVENERPHEAARVVRMLSGYVRELSREEAKPE